MIDSVRKIVVGLILLIPAAAFAAAGYVHDLTGNATVAASPNGTPQALSVGTLIESGSTIRTGAGSSAVIKFEDGQVMVLRENTGFQVTDYAYNKQRISQSRAVFNLLSGGLRFITGVIGSTQNSAYRMTAGPTVTIGVRGTDGDVSYDPVTQAVTAAVNAGAIVMQTPFGERNIPVASFGVFRPGALSEARPTREAPPAVIAAVARSLAQANVPINTPIVVQASANAAVAQSQSRLAEQRAEQAKVAAARAAAAAAQNQANAQLAAQARAAQAAADLAANQAAAAAQRAAQTLAIAVSAAQTAYSEAINSGAKPPAPPAPPPPPPQGAGPAPAEPPPPPPPTSTGGTTSTPTGGAGGGGGGGTASPN